MQLLPPTRSVRAGWHADGPELNIRRNKKPGSLRVNRLYANLFFLSFVPTTPDILGTFEFVFLLAFWSKFHASWSFLAREHALDYVYIGD